MVGPQSLVRDAVYSKENRSITFPMASEYNGSLAAAEVFVSSSEDTRLSYRQALGIIEFDITEACGVEFVASGACASKVVVAFDSEGNTSLSTVGESDRIAVDVKEPGKYYLPVVPKTYAGGYKLTATDEQGNIFEKESISSLTVKAGEVYSIGEISPTFEADATGRATIKISKEGYLEVYYANRKNSKCVILYPGGAYSVHSPGGIGAVIDAFRNTDATLIVDYFTLPAKGTRRDQALADANKAIDLAWENKDIWGGYTKVGVIGNSAGAHLAGYMAQSRYKDVDFQILIYPVVTLEAGKTHDETRLNWLGENPSQTLISQYCNEKHISLNTPPTYLSWSTGDPIVPQAYNGKVMGEALRAAGHKNFEEHVYDDNQHSVNGWPDWPYALYMWLDKLDNDKPVPVDPVNPEAESWSDITTVYGQENNVSFGNIKMYKTENLNGFTGNVAYRFEVPAGKVGMKVEEKWNCDLTTSSERKISGTVRKVRDYTLFIPYQGPADIYRPDGANQVYYNPVIYGPDKDGVTKVLRANDGWNNTTKAYAPAIGIKDGKVQIRPASTKNDGKIYCYSDVKGNGEQEWDVESAMGGLFHLVHNGEALISADTDEALDAYCKTWLATPALTTRLINGQAWVPLKTYARYRHGRVIVGCTAEGGLVIVAVEKIVDWDNTGKLEDAGHNGINGDTRGITFYEAAQLMKRLGCSDAMTVEDLCWGHIILQDGGDRGKDLFKTYRRFDLRGDGHFRAESDNFEFENLVTLCIK